MAPPAESSRTYPSELPAVALRQTVVFPLTLQPLAVNRPSSIEAVNRALAADRLLFLTLQDNESDHPEPNELRRVGTIVAIRQMAKAPNGAIHVIVEGLLRARSEHLSGSDSWLRATVALLPEKSEQSLEVDAASRFRAVSRCAHGPQQGAVRQVRLDDDDPATRARIPALLEDVTRHALLEDDGVTQG